MLAVLGLPRGHPARRPDRTARALAAHYLPEQPQTDRPRDASVPRRQAFFRRSGHGRHRWPRRRGRVRTNLLSPAAAHPLELVLLQVRGPQRFRPGRVLFVMRHRPSTSPSKVTAKAALRRAGLPERPQLPARWSTHPAVTGGTLLRRQLSRPRRAVAGRGPGPPGQGNHAQIVPGRHRDHVPLRGIRLAQCGAVESLTGGVADMGWAYPGVRPTDSKAGRLRRVGARQGHLPRQPGFRRERAGVPGPAVPLGAGLQPEPRLLGSPVRDRGRDGRRHVEDDRRGSRGQCGGRDAPRMARMPLPTSRSKALPQAPARQEIPVVPLQATPAVRLQAGRVAPVARIIAILRRRCSSPRSRGCGRRAIA